MTTQQPETIVSAAEKQAVYAAQRAAKREQWFKDNTQWTKEGLSQIPEKE